MRRRRTSRAWGAGNLARGGRSEFERLNYSQVILQPGEEGAGP